MLLHDLGAQVLVSTPSYAIVIAQAVHDAGIDPATLKLELGLFGGEPWTESLRGEIERALPGLRAVNFYGLSEMCGPGVATECLEARDGLHVHEDHFLVEIVDPQSGLPLDEDVEGELVFTTLAKEAMPLLRYRTGDIASVTFEACRCGRTTARIRGLRGRRDDMIVVRGVNVYPSNVEHALLSVQETAPGAAGPVLPHGRDRGFLDLRMRGQAEVVVGPEHDHLAAAHHDDRVLARFDRPEERPDARRPEVVRHGVRPTLIED